MTLAPLNEKYPIPNGNKPDIEPYSRVRECHDDREAWAPYFPYDPNPYSDEELKSDYEQAEALIKKAWIERGVVVTFADLGLSVSEQNAEIVLPILGRLPDALASAILDSVIE